MSELLECEGAPRDLGLEQGRWCRRSLQADFYTRARWERVALRLGRSAPDSARVGRDLRRYFPQQAEELEGMARGAAVPWTWLVARLVTEGRGAVAAKTFGLAAAAGSASETSVLARLIPPGAVVRRCRPEGGFRSVEVTQPWRTAPLAGVNEAGLSLVVIPGAGSGSDALCAAPAVLIAQDCLQRFDALDGAIDWCVARPGGGEASFLLADAGGEVARVAFDGARRSVSRPADGLILHLDRPDREGDIAKALRDASPLIAADLGRFLGLELLVAEPATRRIGLLHAESDGRWIEISPGTETPRAQDALAG